MEALLVELLIYLDKKTQITSLVTKKFKISDKYSDFANDFSKKKIIVLPEKTKLNTLIIKLENNK